MWILLACLILILSGCAMTSEDQNSSHSVDTLWCVGACALTTQDHDVSTGEPAMKDEKEKDDE